ncbi:MAG: dihydrofolate reductase [Bacteroidetes bacterium]|nr:dihydrofolate reductase [Bacteroidota bacterium]
MYSERKVILYIAMSLDGLIAGANDSLDFLSLVEKKGEDYGYGKFTESVDTVIMGRKTYDKVCSMGVENPHPNKKLFIITRTPKSAIDNIEYFTGNIIDLISELKQRNGKNIFVDGGAEIVNILLKQNLIDEFYISIIPIILGSGISLFQQPLPELNLKLVDSKQFESGLVQIHYSRG